jgi:hypothetical protein
MITKFFIIGILFFEIFLISLWLPCQRIFEKLYFSSFDVLLKLDESIHNDIGYNTFLARFFHNKIIVSSTEIVNKYMLFWDIRSGLLLFSIIGYFGILYGFWTLLTKEKKTIKLWLAICILLLLPLIEIFNLPIPRVIRFVITTGPLYLFSLYGLWQFSIRYKKHGFIILILLAVISIWYFLVMQHDITTYCQNS